MLSGFFARIQPMFPKEQEQNIINSKQQDEVVNLLDREPTPIDRLRALAQAYCTQEFIISGVDEAAKANNLLVVDAIRAAGKRLRRSANDVFGIHIGGSRIKGYNTVNSDIDLSIVFPDTTSHSQIRFIYDVVCQELATRGVKNKLDLGIELWANDNIKTNPQDFVYTVDYEGQQLIALFGNTLYYNPNLLLARLAALEVINQYTYVNYPWDAIAYNYATTYLGERSYIVPKLTERYGFPKDEVGKIFTPALFHERYRRFGLKDPKTMLTELRDWRNTNSKQLGRYRMNQVYRHVLDEIKSFLE